MVSSIVSSHCVSGFPKESLKMAKEGQRRILIAIDGSESAEYAFDWYIHNMKQPNDYVYGITVPEYSFAGIT
ncbi:hypothetical protein DPMN_121498, partial [Dreissena polymorpha]